MRVAYVCLDPGVPVFGCKGSSVHCQEVIRAFLNRGDQVELFAKRLEEDISAAFSDIGTHQIGSKLPRETAMREQALAQINPVLYQRLQDTGPFDLIYERFSLWNDAAMRYAREHSIPGILEVNSPLIHEQKTYRKLMDEPLAQTFQGSCFKNADSIIAVSDEVAASLRSNFFARHKTTVIPNGVNCEKFRGPNRRAKPDSSEVTIGFVGTLKPWHGVAILLDAFSIVHQANPLAKLRIVGDGPERDRLQMQMQRYSDKAQQAVEWLGALPNSQIPDVLSTFDVAVAPYPDLQDFYYSPLKILEYMAAGSAIVASRIGQIPVLVTDNESGVLAQSGCPNALAAAIMKLSDNPTLRTRLGQAARLRAESEFTWQRVVDRILDTIPPVSSGCGVS